MNNFIIENHEGHEIPVDVFTKLAADRVLFIYEDVDDNVAASIIASLFLLDAQSEVEKIRIMINCYGGDIRSIFSIYDTLKMLKCPVETICMGTAADEAVLLLAAGSPGMRYVSENTTLNVSQLSGTAISMGDLTDAKSSLDRNMEDNKRFMTELSSCINKKYSDLIKDFDRVKFFSAKQAKAYGFVDNIIKKKEILNYEEEK